MIGTVPDRARTSAPSPVMRAIAATVVLLGLCLATFAAPAAADEPDRGAGVEIGVVIAPSSDCADVRPPCRCDAGTPTLPPGLVKKTTRSSPDKAPRDWCATANRLPSTISEPAPEKRVPGN
jgi:uncharacterized membrane protein